MLEILLESVSDGRIQVSLFPAQFYFYVVFRVFVGSNIFVAIAAGYGTAIEFQGLTFSSFVLNGPSAHPASYLLVSVCL